MTGKTHTLEVFTSLLFCRFCYRYRVCSFDDRARPLNCRSWARRASDLGRVCDNELREPNSNPIRSAQFLHGRKGPVDLAWLTDPEQIVSQSKNGLARRHVVYAPATISFKPLSSDGASASGQRSSRVVSRDKYCRFFDHSFDPTRDGFADRDVGDAAAMDVPYLLPNFDFGSKRCRGAPQGADSQRASVARRYAEIKMTEIPAGSQRR